MTVYSLCTLCEKRTGKGGGMGENTRKRNKEERGKEKNYSHAHGPHVVPWRNSTVPLKIIQFTFLSLGKG